MQSIPNRVALIDSDLLCYQLGYVFDETVPDRIVQNKVDERIEDITNESNCTDSISYLTESASNFRNAAATISKYKGNRVSTKPYHYYTIRAHLTDEHDAVVSDGCEADDLIADAMVANRDTSVICSIDKDLDTIWSWHYKWSMRGRPAKGLHYVSPHEAYRFFCKQLLMGDSADNILGVYGIGDKKAEAILSRCKGDEGFREAVKEAYRETYGDSICFQTHRGKWVERTSEEILRENWELLYIGGGTDRVRNREKWFGEST